MKKLFGTAAVLVLLSGTVSASPVGWIHPEQGRFTISGEAGKIVDRDMEQVNSGTRRMYELDSFHAMGRGSYGLTDQLEAYVRLGGADANLDGTTNAAGYTFNSSTDFAWGAGVQGIIYDAGSWNIGGDAQYFGHSSHTGNSNSSATGPGIAVDFDYGEWQVGLQLQGTFDQFYPYVGVKYSDVTLNYSRPGGVADMDADDNVGVYVGSGFQIAPQWSGYIEGRFVDETAFGGGIGYRF